MRADSKTLPFLATNGRGGIRYAQNNRNRAFLPEEEALKRGMEEKSKEFVENGAERDAEVYLKA